MSFRFHGRISVFENPISLAIPTYCAQRLHIPSSETMSFNFHGYTISYFHEQNQRAFVKSRLVSVMRIRRGVHHVLSVLSLFLGATPTPYLGR